MQANGKVKRYIELNSKYINDTEECLKKGDYAQVSEKLWGATVTIVKAIAAQRGKTIKTHEGVRAFLVQIARELKDESIHNMWLIAEGLHQNFYENSLTVEFVRKGSKTIRLFINRMKKHFSLN